MCSARDCGASSETRTARRRALSVNATSPKAVGARRTTIFRPGRSHPRGVAYASSSPLPVSWTSISLSVSRNVALLPAFGGRNIFRKYSPGTGATVAPSPDT